MEGSELYVRVQVVSEQMLWTQPIYDSDRLNLLRNNLKLSVKEA